MLSWLIWTIRGIFTKNVGIVKYDCMLYCSTTLYNASLHFSRSLLVLKWENVADKCKTRPHVVKCMVSFLAGQQWVLKLDDLSHWSLILNFKDDVWTMIHMCSQIKRPHFQSAEADFWHIHCSPFRLYYAGAEKTISTLSKYFGLEVDPFPVIWLWSENLNLL